MLPTRNRHKGKQPKNGVKEKISKDFSGKCKTMQLRSGNVKF